MQEMPRQRIVLVEDDASIRRLVALALEDLLPELHAELVPCVDVAAGLQALRAGPVRLLITDLMLPGVSGYELLAQLQADPTLAGAAQLVVCSAGLDASARARLQALGVWRQLLKPVSVQALEDCVREALTDMAAADEASAPRPAQASLLGSTRASERDPPVADSAARAHAVATHFGGDTGLFEAYRATCLVQFGDDVQRGDQAMSLQDVLALRRLGHSLKSVLQSLGEIRLAAEARALETAALAGDGPRLQQAWGRLRAGLQALAATEAGSGPGRSGPA